MLAVLDWKDHFSRSQHEDEAKNTFTAKILDFCEELDKQIYIRKNPDSPEARAVEEQNVAEDPIPGLSEQPVNEYVQKRM